MQYSAFLLAGILRNIAFPLAAVSFSWHRFCTSHSWSIWGVVCILSLVLNYFLLSYMSLVKQQFDARRLHPEAVPIPRVRGRWPFNTDILMDWMASSKDEYLGEGMISRLERIYGQTLNTRVLGEDSVITTSPEHVSQMLTSSFLAFEKGAKWKERVHEMMGDGVFSSDGSLWKYHRATIRPFFGHSRAPLEEILEPHTSKFVTVLENLGSLSNGSSPRAFDVQHITRCLALDVAMSWLCGQSTGLLDECLDRDHPCKSGKTAKSEGNKVFEAFAEAQAVASMRLKAGTFWSLFEWRKNRMAAPMKVIRGFIGPVVAAAIRTGQVQRIENATRAGPCGGEVKGGGTLLHYLVQVLNDPRAIEDEIINMLVAASDTTAAALTACIYCLAMYPECVAEMARECDRIAETKGRLEDALKGCEYLNAFVHEVLRLYPPVPLNIRRSNSAGLLQPLDPGLPPLFFPAHTSVIMSTLSIQRDPKVWGPDAHVFDPRRWMGNDPRSQKGYPFGIPGFGKAAYPVFHLGPRSCLGQAFASQQLAYTMLRLAEFLNLPGRKVPSHHLALAPDAQPPGTRVPNSWKTLTGRGKEEQAFWSSNMTLYFKGGLWMRIVKKEDKVISTKA